MRLKNLTPFLFAKITVSREPPQPELVAIVRALYRIVPGGVVTPITSPKPFPQGKITGDLYEEENGTEGDLTYSSDLAAFKPRADLLLKGTVRAPAGQATKEVGVRFAVGAFSKILRVTGPRAWSDPGKSAVLSAPVPFSTMELSYRQALGGAGDDANPVGKGREGQEGPRVERPNEPVHSRGDSFAPAGFGPLHPEWSERRAKLGRNVGKEYRANRAPHFPSDFDFAFFNAAPADQQVPYLRGDEDVLVQNAHPGEAVLKTRLASERVRVFVKDKAGDAREVAMHLDTVLVDTDQDTVTVTWRGLTPCADPFGEDVEFVLVTREELGAFDQKEAYFEVLDRFSKDPLGLDEHLTPETRGFFDGSGRNLTKTGDPIDDLLKKRFGTAAPAEQAKIRELLQKASNMGAKEARTGEAIAAGVVASANASGPSFSGAGKPGVLPSLKLGAPISAVEDEARRARRAMGPRSVLGGRSLDASELEKVERLRDDERLRRLDPSLAKKRVKRDKTRPPEPGEDASDGDFTDADFEGRDLSGVNFSGAVLERANLKRCKLVGAIFEQAILFEAHLEDADLSGANLRQANLGQVKGDRAIFERATIDQASFENARLPGARFGKATGEYVILRGAQLDAADFKGATLIRSIADRMVANQADFTGAHLEHTLFHRAECHQTKFDGAFLGESGFLHAVITECSLVRVKAAHTAWLYAKIARSDFTGAILDHSFFNSADAFAARFRGASLIESRFVSAKVTESDFSGANLHFSDFSHAGIARVKFDKANLFGSLFHGAGGAGVSLRGAILKRSSLEEA